ncbi:DUF4142 domain-containing protein [Robbsia sp. KACC 23696]|uniref:DUF4142 domain-containing protein n=1 Tax=Robbsia sp. KACC 23696 TaxID=3149231 RepID=UPI00325BFD18
MIHRNYLPTVLATFVMCAAILPASGYAATAESSATTANDLPEPDKSFVQAATMASSNEITAGDFALNKSHNTDVENYAKRMMSEHRIMAVKLKAAVPLSARAPMGNVDAAMVNALKDKQSDAFNMAYIKTVALEGHKTAIAAFENEASNGKNSSLRAFAAKQLPELREHYRMAQELAKKNHVLE